jgi:hypothetical protein
MAAPPYQAPVEPVRAARQTALAVDAATNAAERRWPSDQTAEFVALRAALRDPPPAAPAEIARLFKGAPRGDRLPKMLQTPVALGQARSLESGRYTA